MNFSHYFIDFDETLFNHYAYMEWLEEALYSKQLLKNSLISSLDKYHASKGANLRLYNHRGHITYATGMEWSYVAGVIDTMLQGQKNDFCYPDAHALLRSLTQKNNDVRILTYGDGEYQRFKIRTCREIAQLHIPVHVVQTAKSIFLQTYFSDASIRGILADDKYPLHLPDNWHHAHINRSNSSFLYDRGTTPLASLQQLATIGT